MTTPDRKIGDLSPEQRALLERRLLDKLEASRTSHGAIPRRASSAETPLSYAQQRLWLLDQLEPGLPSYNVGRAYRLYGPLRAGGVEFALRELMGRHEALRTVYQARDGVPAQIIREHAELAFVIQDLSALPKEEQERTAQALAEAENSRPFDLANGPVLRACLIRLDRGDHLLVVVVHHIATDGWSEGVFWREFATLYASYVSGKEMILPELPLQYADFAVWQRDRLTGEKLAASLDYWRDALGDLSPLALPIDRPRRAVPTRQGTRARFRLGGLLSEQLKQYARQNGVTPYMVLLANLQLLLYQFADQPVFAIGTPVAGRNHLELEPIVGFFVNTLVLRADLSGDPTFRAFLARVHRNASAAFTHQDVPFDLLVKSLSPLRERNRQPLFDVMFQYVRNESAGWELPGMRIEPVGLDNGTAKFDLSVTLSERDGEIAGSIVFSNDLFDADTIDRLGDQYRALLAAAIADPDLRLSEIAQQAGNWSQPLPESWSGMTTEYPREATIHSLFGQQVAQRPDAIALLFEDEAISYTELNQRAEKIAEALLRHGLAREAPVGLWLSRSPHVMAAILGVLKAGGAYFPLDTGYPASRLAFMLEDASVSIVLSERALVDSLPDTGAERLLVDDLPNDSDSSRIENRRPIGQAEDLAYLMYTSGSTGRPKGVAITHRGVVRLVCNTNYAQLGPDEAFLQLAPLAFDASTFEIWAALLHGAPLVLPPDGLPEFAVLEQLIERHGVSILWLTTGLFNAVVDHRPQLLRMVQHVMTGGEVMSVSHVRKAQRIAPHTRITNFYGPTENTTFTTFYPIPQPLGEEVMAVPIGRPIANTTVYILDDNLEAVPLGTVGELYVGGDGLARGYLDRPELTAERFVSHPSRPNECLYRTGDRARWLPDGTIAFVGRVDNQIKLRGHRIEPAEIQAHLDHHPHVAQSYVTLDETVSSDPRLVAYVVSADGSTPDSAALREYLRMALPPPMIPWAFVSLERLPLTPNGKVDRSALTAFQASGRQGEGLAARETLSPVEEVVAAVFQEVLGIDLITIDDNFFNLGGHSLLAVQAVSRISERVGVLISPGTLIEHSSVGDLALAIVDQLAGEAAVSGPVNRVNAPPPDRSRLAPYDVLDHAFSPLTSAEATLAQIWSAVLRVEQVSRDDDFFSLGGHSLAALQVAAQIEERLGYRLLPAMLFEARTIADLAALIEQSPSEDGERLLVPIQPLGDLPPFFCVHGFGGGVVGYADLAATLGDDRPFYGIQAVGLSGTRPPDTTIEEMAAHYLEAIREIQPRGPYRIGGYCFGGVVAFEMARQLASMDEHVVLLTIIEGYAPRQFHRQLAPGSLERWRVVVQNVPFWWQEYWDLGLKGLRQRLAQKQRNWLSRRSISSDQTRDVDLTAHVPDELGLLPEHRRALMEHHLRALRSYQPEPLEGPLTLYAAQGKTVSSALFGSGDPANGWEPLVKGGLDIRVVDGGHRNLHLAPFVSSLGAALKADLRRADG